MKRPGPKGFVTRQTQCGGTIATNKGWNYGTRDGVLQAAEQMISDPKTAAGRAFLTSLNILLRYARLYGFEHVRTADQLGMAFKELVAAIPSGSGLLLGAAGSRLLLDGVPLEGAAEKQLAHMLAAAGLASVQFFPTVTEEELARFAQVFPKGKAKPS